jgi:ribonuclease D
VARPAPSASGDAGAYRYLETPDAAEAFLGEIGATRDLALDTEAASFHRFIDRVYLLQVTARVPGTGAAGPGEAHERSAVVDPLTAGSVGALGRLVEDPAVEVVFHDADYDLRLLRQDYGWQVRGLFDTRVAAQLLGERAFGLAALLDKEFGVKLDKRHQRADWSMRPLTPDMLDYAAQDTIWLLQLRDRFRERLARLGRLAWAEEEFQRLEGVQWNGDGADDAYLRMKGARDLTRRELALLASSSAWRDGSRASSTEPPSASPPTTCSSRSRASRRARARRCRPSRASRAARSTGAPARCSGPWSAASPSPTRRCRASRARRAGTATPTSTTG